MKTNWFDCSIKYERMAEEGKIVKVKETYLIDALSFTEAEARIIEHLEAFIEGDFTVSTVKRGKISEMFFNENGEHWFKAKVLFITLDEDKGVEKKTACTMLVQANDIEEAITGIKDGMKGSMADYEIWSVSNTEIVEVVKYDTDDIE